MDSSTSRATVGNGGVVSGGGRSMDGGIVGGDRNGRDGGIVEGDGGSRDGGIVGGDVGIAGGRFFGLEPQSVAMATVYIFAEADDFKNIVEPLQNVARKFKPEVLFLYIDIEDDNLAKPFLTLLGREEAEETVVAAFDNKISTKYLLESDPTPSKIEEFCSGVLHGTLAPFYKSQPIPDNVSFANNPSQTEGSIQTIVGKTFDELILSSPQNTFLEVHTPRCITCEATSKKVEKLAKHFKGLDDLTFARIDAYANEHPKLQVNDYPTLLFYPAHDKSNPIKLPSKSSLKDLATLINKNLKTDHKTKDEL
ncbi:hypothetical protein RHSIM_Rhsim08G0222800 [Rhododendron simsii]|uniref:Thioredoxin domain-containing protein n=1 Tax=Rhododendron simsii TaxID=118357 RepID=A0A834GKX7_RHOSS|nr:hypothetical protein RHSIM_Rhsim08G0222800 [Rhododendron simsii]